METKPACACAGMSVAGIPALLTRIAIGYGALVNVGAGGLFYYDKQQAVKGGWRVPEKNLQLTALLGGWLGGFFAMKRFKHKRSKPAFLKPYYLATGANVAMLGGVAFLARYKPQLLSSFFAQFSRKNLKDNYRAYQQQQQQYNQYGQQQQQQQQQQQTSQNNSEYHQQQSNHRKRRRR